MLRLRNATRSRRECRCNRRGGGFAISESANEASASSSHRVTTTETSVPKTNPAQAEEFKPDVAILDITMPSLNGLEATRQIAKLSPRTKVLILSIHESDQLIHKLVGAGARGYILKADAGRHFITAVNALLANKTFFTPKVAQKVRDGHLDKVPKASEEEFSADNGETKRGPAAFGGGQEQ